MMSDNIMRLLIPTNSAVSIDAIKSAFHTAGVSLLSHQDIRAKKPTPTCRCLEIHIETHSAWNTNKADSISSTLGVDILYRPKISHPLQLVAFDMDATVIKIEVIDELARAHGVYDKVSHLTDMVLAGKLNFKDGFKARMRLLKGLSVDALEEIGESIPYTPGAQVLFDTLQHANIDTILISGGFLYFADIVKAKLGITQVYANSLDISKGVLTGNITSPIIGAKEKALRFKQTCQEKGIPLSNTMAVGDGANDIPMMLETNLSVSYHGKPALRKITQIHIDHVGLDGLIYLL